MIHILTAFRRVGRIMGFEVYVTHLLLIFVALFGLLRLLGGFFFAAIGLLFYPVFVFLHEMGHSLIASAMGIRIRRILLHVLGGYAELADPIPGSLAEIVIALAGPFVNLFLASLFLFPPLLLRGVAPPEGSFLGELAYQNLFLAFFNLFPIFPMDGGRVATALAIQRRGFEDGIRLMRYVSQGGIVVVALMGVGMLFYGRWDGIFFLAIALLLYLQGDQEIQARVYASQYLEGATLIWRESPMNIGTDVQASWDSVEEEGSIPQRKKEGWLRRLLRRRQEKREERERARRRELERKIDAILAKVKQEGIGSLTPQERELLHRASVTYCNEKNKKRS